MQYLQFISWWRSAFNDVNNWTPSTKYLLLVQKIIVYFLRKNIFFSSWTHFCYQNLWSWRKISDVWHCKSKPTWWIQHCFTRICHWSLQLQRGRLQWLTKFENFLLGPINCFGCFDSLKIVPLINCSLLVQILESQNDMKNNMSSFWTVNNIFFEIKLQFCSKIKINS